MPHAITYEQALAALTQGGLVIYPTETFYGMGCVATNEHAVQRVFAIKNRPPDKPLPVVIGDASQLSLVAATVPDDARRLARAFWPGSLSILLPAAPALPDLLTGPARRVAVRVTPHPLAARLCLDLAAPLAASSANPAGAPPAATPAEIDPELAALTHGILAERPWPGGGEPSTVVELAAPGELRILRAGAVSARALEASGFVVLGHDGRPAC